MKILITGGAGFIGAHVARTLLLADHDVVILDDFNDRYNPRLKEARLEHLVPASPALTVVRGSICDQTLVTTLFAEHQFNTVIHLAAWASVQTSLQQPTKYMQVNLEGTTILLEAARQYGNPHFVFASSSSVYGGSTPPFAESMPIITTLSPYAVTKAAGELLCSTWHTMYQLPITCLRFFTVYGPWGRPEMAIFQFAEALQNGQPIYMRGSTTKRDFTYIDDIVQGIIAAVNKPNPTFAIYNLGEHDSVPLPRLIQALESAMNQSAKIIEVPLPPGDIADTLADITKAQTELHYQPTTSIEAGITKFVDWYLNWYVKQLA